MTVKEFMDKFCGGVNIEISVPIEEYDDLIITTDRNQLMNTNLQANLMWLMDLEISQFTITEDLNDTMTLFIHTKRLGELELS